jgi:prohibitin 2
VLFRPKEKKLAELYRYLGLNYDERVMSSIVNEVVKSVVAQVINKFLLQYSALQLMSQRDQISNKIRKQLEERASLFYIVIDDVSITELHFNREYTEAIE